MYPRIARFRFFVPHRYQNQNRTVLERSTRGTLSVLDQSTVGAKKPHSFANLKEIVHLQYMVLNCDSHPVESVENSLTCESFAWKYSPAEEMRIFYERVSFLSFQREHAQRPHASPIYQWLADVQNSRMWFADEFALYRFILLIKLMITKEWSKIMTASVYFYSTIKNCNATLMTTFFRRLTIFSRTLGMLWCLLNGDGQQRCLCQEIATSI